MNSSQSIRFTRFFLFSVKSCKFYLLIMLGISILSAVITILGGGALIILLWESCLVWFLRGNVIMFALFFVGVVWESLQ
jgi:hypothetical protein